MLNYTTIGESTLKTPVCGVNEIPALLCGVIKPKLLQNLIFKSCDSINEKTGNYQILPDVMRFAKNISI